MLLGKAVSIAPLWMHSTTTPYYYLSIGSSAYKPWLPIHPLDLQHAKPITNIMSTKNLQRNDQRISHEIVVYPAVEDLDGAVVRRRGEEGICWMEVERPNGPGMVAGNTNAVIQLLLLQIQSRYAPHNLVRLFAQLQIEPAQLSVVSTNNDMVPRRMNIHGRYPSYPGHQGFDQLLLH